MEEKEKVELKEWFQEAAWIYPKEENKFITFLTKEVKKEFPNVTIWRSEHCTKSKEKYPQYLCSADLDSELAGDTVQLWRDGQTFWPVCGDYSIEDEEKIELILRKSILKFLSK